MPNEQGIAPATFDATCADCGSTLTYHGKPLGPGETFHCGCQPRIAPSPTTEEWAASLSPLDCERIIEKAMADRDFRAVKAALDLLARKDPERADAVLSVIKAGLAIAVERAAAEVDEATAEAIDEARRAVRGIK